MTKVINIRKAPYDWRLSDDYVYIGRPGKGMSSIFGNPVIMFTNCCFCGAFHTENGDTLPCYEKYLRDRIERNVLFKKKFLELRNKTLVCFCKPRPCHGDIIVKVLNEYN